MPAHLETYELNALLAFGDVDTLVLVNAFLPLSGTLFRTMTVFAHLAMLGSPIMNLKSFAPWCCLTEMQERKQNMH